MSLKAISKHDIDGLVQDCVISIANILEISVLTHWGRVTHICVNNLDHHWLVAYLAPSHYLNQCWNKLQWNFYRNLNISIQEKALGNVFCLNVLNKVINFVTLHFPIAMPFTMSLHLLPKLEILKSHQLKQWKSLPLYQTCLFNSSLHQRCLF